MRTYKLNALRKALKADNAKHLNGQLELLDELETVQQIKDSWQMKEYFTPWSKRNEWHSAADLKRYLADRIRTKYAKRLEKELSQFETVLDSGKLIEATITVEWKKNRTWGSNPRAHIKGSYENEFGTTHYFSYESDSISGCGYDKGSTAVAQVVNQVNAILRAFYIKKNRTPDAKNREVLGYGAGYGILPRLEGGVGVSCYPRIFEAIGYKFETVASGSTFEVYKIGKK